MDTLIEKSTKVVIFEAPSLHKVANMSHANRAE